MLILVLLTFQKIIHQINSKLRKHNKEIQNIKNYDNRAIYTHSHHTMKSLFKGDWSNSLTMENNQVKERAR